MTKKILRLEISLTNLHIDEARGEIAIASLRDLKRKKIVKPGFAIGLIKTNPLRFIIIHPTAQKTLVYLPSTDIAQNFFFTSTYRPIAQTSKSIEKFWPLATEALYMVIMEMEKYWARLTAANDSLTPFKPLLKAWRIYRSYHN